MADSCCWVETSPKNGNKNEVLRFGFILLRQVTNQRAFVTAAVSKQVTMLEKAGAIEI